MSEQQTVVFNLKGQLFGADASQVFQIIRYQEVTKVPRMPRFLEGIINYRGDVIPVVSLIKRFDMGEDTITRKTKVLLTRIDGKLAGFMVDDVAEILRFTEEETEPAPGLLYGEAGTYLKNVGKKGDKLVSIIDLSKVLNDSEIKRLNVKAQ